MVTISHLVNKYVREKPFIEDALFKGIINYVALAESIKEDIEKELGKAVKVSAIMMALRRYSDTINTKSRASTKLHFREADLAIKSDLFEITILKSRNTINNIKKIYDLTDITNGDFLTITQGVYEMTLISNKKHRTRIEYILKEENVIKIIDNLGALTVRIPPAALNTMGFFYIITKSIHWDNINIVEIVSTLTEITLILKERDIPKAFETLKRLIVDNE